MASVVNDHYNFEVSFKIKTTKVDPDYFGQKLLMYVGCSSPEGLQVWKHIIRGKLTPVLHIERRLCILNRFLSLPYSEDTYIVYYEVERKSDRDPCEESPNYLICLYNPLGCTVPSIEIGDG